MSSPLQLLPRSRCLSLIGISSNRKHVQQIHVQMIANSFFGSSLCIAKLIEQYISVGAPRDSFKVFALAPSRDKFAYTHALRASARLGALREGMQAHGQVLKTGLSAEVAVLTTVIDFYANCKDIHSARKLFDEMPVRTGVTWSAMLAGYCDNGRAKETFLLLSEMLRQHIKPTVRTAVTLLSACSELNDLNLGCAAHGFIHKFTVVHGDCFIGTELIAMYSRCGSLDDAYKVFEEMSKRNVLTWTAMVSGLAMHGKGKEAFDMMDEMQRRGVSPNEVTFTCVLSACCHGGHLEEGVWIFDAIRERFRLEPSVHHYGCLVDMLGRAGYVEEAREVVRRMPIEPDLVVWRALLSACNVHGHVKMGKEVGEKLVQSEKAQRRLRRGRSCQDFVALSNVYASAGRWEDVQTVRGLMKSMRVSSKAGRSSAQVV